jgi:hypothetical protein
MATMDEAVDFARRWTEQEWAVATAQHRERDDAAFGRQVDALQAGFYGTGLVPRATRTANEAFWEKAETYLGALQQRKVLRVDRHTPADGGEVFAIYVTSTNAGAGGLFGRYLARDDGSGLRLVTQENRCTECRGSGEVDGDPCPQCDGAGFVRRGGQDLGELGPVAESGPVG